MEQHAGTNVEPEHVGQKTRTIEMVNEFQQIYVLLTHTVAALVDVLIIRKLIFCVAIHNLRWHHWWCVMMALLASHSWFWWWASKLWKTKLADVGQP